MCWKKSSSSLLGNRHHHPYRTGTHYFCTANAITLSCALRLKLQLPVSITTLLNSGNLPEHTRIKWIHLDGRRIFQIAALQDNLSERVQQVQSNLDRIAEKYYNDDRQQPSVEIKTSNRLPTIDINGQRLLTITNLDAQVRSIDPDTLATQLQTTLKEADYPRAKQERQKPFLIQASQISAGILAATAILSWGLSLSTLSSPQKVPNNDQTIKRLTYQTPSKRL